MDTVSDTAAERSHACLHKLHRHSLDSGVYVNMEIYFDDSLLNTESEETNSHKENIESDYPAIISQPAAQNNNGDLVEEERDVNQSDRSDQRLKGSTSAIAAEVDNTKDLKPCSISVIPPPVLPKRYQRSPAFEKTSKQGPPLKVFHEDDKLLNSLINKIPNVHNSSTLEILEVETKCPPQPSLNPARKPPKKPPRRKHNVERAKHEDQVGQKKRQEQNLTESSESTDKNEETYAMERNTDEGKPLQQEKVKEDGQDMGKEDRDINYMKVTENSCPLLPDKKPDMTAAGNYASPSPPKPPIKPPQLFNALIEKKKERRRREEEQLRDEDLMYKTRYECEEKGNGDCRDEELTIPTVTEMSIPKSSAGQEVNLQRQKQIFCLMPPCRNKPNAAEIYENQTCHESRRDSNVKTVKWTEDNKEIQISDEEIPEQPSGSRQGTEVFRMNQDPCQLGLKTLENKQEICETVLDGELKQTNLKPSTRKKVKNFAMKMICKLKEAREEKRRSKAREHEMNGERGCDPEVMLDYDTVAPANKSRLDVTDWEEGGMEEEQDEEEMGEYETVQSAVTESQEGIMGRYTASESSVCSRGVECSQPCTEHSHAPDPHSEAHPSGNVQPDSRAELGPSPDVFTAVVEEEPLYEDIDLSNIVKVQQKKQVPPTASPQMCLEDTNVYDTVEVTQPAIIYVNLSDIKSEEVLDNSVQKYLIKLGKKRKQKQRRGKGQGREADTNCQPPPQHAFTTSVFYDVPAAGRAEEQQLSTVKPGGPRNAAKVKVPQKVAKTTE